jgi:purine-binding chemotaxis protein CheW
MKPNVRTASGRIDWEAAHARLAAAEPNARNAREEAKRVLAERALRLAVVLAPEEAASAWLEVLMFQRGARRYAIESRFVIEVGKCGRLSRVPGSAPALLGMTNLRGDLLPVFDLTVLGDAGMRERPQTAQLLVLGQKSADFGVLADAVDEVLRVPTSSLSEPHVVGSLPHPEYVRGITEQGCALLDGDALLRDRALFVAKKSAGSLPGRDLT